MKRQPFTKKSIRLFVNYDAVSQVFKETKIKRKKNLIIVNYCGLSTRLYR